MNMLVSLEVQSLSSCATSFRVRGGVTGVVAAAVANVGVD